MPYTVHTADSVTEHRTSRAALAAFHAAALAGQTVHVYTPAGNLAHGYDAAQGPVVLVDGELRGAPVTTKPRTIDAAAYRAARAEGLRPDVAAYAARPAVLDLDWMTHYQVDETWADFTHNGRQYIAEVIDPRTVEGECIGCRELVDAYRRQDDGIAWMTPDEYEATEHAAVTVIILDEAGDRGESASLWGVCSTERTPTERRIAARYLAETVADLAEEAARAETVARELAAQRRAERVAAVLGYPAAFAA